MSSTHRQMFEGVGAPVDVSRIDAGHVDPTLDSCCQREIESNRKRDAVVTALRAHDRVAHAEDRRRREQNLLHGMTFGSGCRCCYDPDGDGGEYEMLAEARRERDDAATNRADFEEEQKDDADETGRAEDSDSDSDDEFDYLLDEDVSASGVADDLQSQRRVELETLAQHAEAAREHGYGVHRQMHPRRVFPSVGCRSGDGARDRARVRGAAVHLYDAHSSLSVSLDLCLEDLARRYAGTKFVRSLGVSSLPYAKDGDGARWKSGQLPMMLAVRDGEVVAYSSGLRDFCGRGGGGEKEVEPGAVERWLDRAGALLANPPPAEELCNIRPEEEMLLENMRQLNRSGGGAGFGGMMRYMDGGRSDEKEDHEEDRYECGVAGCCKSFYHEHVGVKNEAQDGLLIAESQVASSAG